MISKLGKILLCGCVCSLTACGTTESSNYYATYGSSYPAYFQGQQYYSHVYDGTASYGEIAHRVDPMKTSESYYSSPISHREVDSKWVHRQNPQGYTIEVGESDKPALIAKKLHQAPKVDRTAQLKSQRDGKTYYKGIYGSYSNYEEAQKALNKLPETVKEGARIQNWSSVQDSVNE